MPPLIFVAEVLGQRRSNIAKFRSAEQVEEIESDHRSLCPAYIVNESVKTKIDQHDHETMFNIGWDDVQAAYQKICSVVCDSSAAE
uniref:Uncharacterized protein n=1 Tax=Hyaloperonospora arabidopsidis (strain Emoy2) TaxID=559515 RepID=M4C4I1_HYAAE